MGKYALSLGILGWSDYSHLGLLTDWYEVSGTEKDELEGAESQTFNREPSDIGTALPCLGCIDCVTILQSHLTLFN